MPAFSEHLEVKQCQSFYAQSAKENACAWHVMGEWKSSMKEKGNGYLVLYAAAKTRMSLTTGSARPAGVSVR
jgi:hypothetical protein